MSLGFCVFEVHAAHRYTARNNIYAYLAYIGLALLFLALLFLALLFLAFSLFVVVSALLF